MGNWAPKPTPVRNVCRTPGTVYETEFYPAHFVHRVVLPVPGFEGMRPDQQTALAKRLHDATLPIVEEFYRDNWKKLFADRRIDGATMPKEWSEL